VNGITILAASPNANCAACWKVPTAGPSGGRTRPLGPLPTGAVTAAMPLLCSIDEDALIRMRAADALEKATVRDASAIAPFRKELVDFLSQTEQKEMRWHLAQMVPRLPLDTRERRIAVAALERYLEDSSSIVRTCALEALSRLASRNSTLQARIQELLRAAERNGTPELCVPEPCACLGNRNDCIHAA